MLSRIPCLAIISFVLAILSCLALCISTSTTRWKEDIDTYKGMRRYIGLWRACISVDGESISGLPAYEEECDKDFLRPQLVEPPSWFIAVRVLMILACIGSGIGLFLFSTALATEGCKKTGSRYWPASLVNFSAGLCALVALVVFTEHHQMSVQFAFVAGKYYALYWHEEPGESIINGVFFKIELWLRWSYMLGWCGFGFSLFSLIAAVINDAIRRPPGLN